MNGQRLIAVLFVTAAVAFVWIGYRAGNQGSEVVRWLPASLKPHQVRAAPAHAGAAPVVVDGFRCDGRTHCSQMTSCAEARQFLRHCSGTEMDGDNDGIPCEQQWCGGLD